MPQFRAISDSFARVPLNRVSLDPSIVEAKHESDMHSSTNSTFVLNDSSADSSAISLHHFGEVPTSFRTCLKRFVFDNSIQGYTASSAPYGVVQAQDVIFPQNWNPYGNTTVPITQTLFSYMRYAYIGVRGSIRKRIAVIAGGTSTANATCIITLDPEANIDPSITCEVVHLDSGGSFWYDVATTLDGGQQVALSSNTGFEIEFPFYSRNLFHFSFTDNFIGSNPGSSQGMDPYWTRSYSLTAPLSALNNGWNVGFNVDVAAGEDFCFIGFQGAPLFSS
jgi:hypothetical protein